MGRTNSNDRQTIRLYRTVCVPRPPLLSSRVGRISWSMYWSWLTLSPLTAPPLPTTILLQYLPNRHSLSLISLREYARLELRKWVVKLGALQFLYLNLAPNIHFFLPLTNNVCHSLVLQLLHFDTYSTILLGLNFGIAIIMLRQHEQTNKGGGGLVSF